jgi:pilus assembly protein CpaF
MLTQDGQTEALAVLLDFLPWLQGPLTDASVTEVLVNPDLSVWLERGGVLVPFDKPHDGWPWNDAGHIMAALNSVASSQRLEFSERQPVLDTRLPDGSRVNALWPRQKGVGPAVAIRRFPVRYSLNALQLMGAMTADMRMCLERLMATKHTGLIAGAVGTGKTTLLRAMVESLPDRTERLVVIEENSELDVEWPNIVPMEGHIAQAGIGGLEEGIPELTMRQMIRASLRQRPDRIIVQEIRDAEAFDLLLAMNTGHRGILTTLHANSADDALLRFADCVLYAERRIPYGNILHQIGRSVDFVVFIERHGPRRVVTDLVRVTGFDRTTERFEIQHGVGAWDGLV